jgi:hypothetical protein
LSNSNVAVVGGVCVERLESWLLALTGRTKTESMGRDRTVSELEAVGVKDKDTATMVEHVQRHGIAGVPADAVSLHAWLTRVGACLSEPSP